jgi:hypothetical protein
MSDAMPGENHQPQSTQQPQPLPVDDSKATPLYANFCRVTGTPEELIVDFGLNTTGGAQPITPLPISQRIVMNFYTAKRLWQTLGMTIQRHETTFGVLETNVQKRASPRLKRQASA